VVAGERNAAAARQMTLRTAVELTTEYSVIRVISSIL
jgi:hypothetical protein